MNWVDFLTQLSPYMQGKPSKSTTHTYEDVERYLHVAVKNIDLKSVSYDNIEHHPEISKVFQQTGWTHDEFLIESERRKIRDAPYLDEQGRFFAELEQIISDRNITTDEGLREVIAELKKNTPT